MMPQVCLANKREKGTTAWLPGPKLHGAGLAPAGWGLHDVIRSELRPFIPAVAVASLVLVTVSGWSLATLASTQTQLLSALGSGLKLPLTSMCDIEV